MIECWSIDDNGPSQTIYWTPEVFKRLARITIHNNSPDNLVVLETREGVEGMNPPHLNPRQTITLIASAVTLKKTETPKGNGSLSFGSYEIEILEEIEEEEAG